MGEDTTMHPPILSRYIFNILYNVMIRVIYCEKFNTNENKYLKLDDGIMGATFKVSNHSTLSSSKKSQDISLHTNTLDSNWGKN